MGDPMSRRDSLSWTLALSGGEACGLGEVTEQSLRNFHLILVEPGHFKTAAP